LGAAVIGCLYFARRQSESGAVPKIDYSDPYLLAYLRRGEGEAIRVAAISLVDRGLLQMRDDQLKTARSDAARIARRPLEKALLDRLRVAAKIEDILDSPSLKAACKEYQSNLEQLQLIPNEEIVRLRQFRLAIALCVLIGVATIKIGVAISRGRLNILFLILLTTLFVYLAVRQTNPVRTRRGDVLLADLKTLFVGLKNRAARIMPGGGTADAALLMAVFGIAALPTTAFPFVRKFKEKHRSTTPTRDASTCGSSCSGGSCGGGGGCGGCGGGGD
jgi:uncharacterized protein (TIGR04222 family)